MNSWWTDCDFLRMINYSKLFTKKLKILGLSFLVSNILWTSDQAQYYRSYKSVFFSYCDLSPLVQVSLRLNVSKEYPFKSDRYIQ